jgi:hypothetical protein
MKHVPLTHGRVALVDDEDYELVMQRNWFVSSTGYAIANRQKNENGNKPPVLMHRLILNPGVGVFVDHISGRKLDNRRSNLRIATPQQNGFNRGLNSNNRSGEKGVCWHGFASKWRASITINRKQIHLGLYTDIKEAAAAAYRVASAKLHGDFLRV